MKFLYLLTLLVLAIPITQLAHAQNILDQIGQTFNDLTSGMMGGGNTTNQTSSTNSSNSSSTGQSINGSSNQSTNESASQPPNELNQGIANITELENATGSNKQIFANNTDIASNVTLGQGMEKSQLGDTIPGEQEAKYEGQVLQNATQS